MSTVKNISGGDLDVPFLDRVVAAGEVVDVPDVQADGESPLVWLSEDVSRPPRWEAVTSKPAKSSGKAAE